LEGDNGAVVTPEVLDYVLSLADERLRSIEHGHRAYHLSHRTTGLSPREIRREIRKLQVAIKREAGDPDE
jgi:hypothetical protein